MVNPMKKRLLVIGLLGLGSMVNIPLTASSMEQLRGDAVSNPSIARALWSVIGAVVATKLANTLELKKKAKPSIEETDRDPDGKAAVAAPESQKAIVAMRPVVRRLMRGALQTLAFAGYISTIYHLAEWYKNGDDWDVESSRWEKRLKVVESAEEVVKGNQLSNKERAKRMADSGITDEAWIYKCGDPVVVLNNTYSGKLAINKLAKLGARLSADKNGEITAKSLLNPFTESGTDSKKLLADRGLQYIQSRIGIQKIGIQKKAT
ncbi:MAG: hypothetical protein QG604_255 [Candidatus Dependentiae bacterium]|nr:hypothetical protein [Candidatus Dependentiae bacterium]